MKKILLFILTLCPMLALNGAEDDWLTDLPKALAQERKQARGNDSRRGPQCRQIPRHAQARNFPAYGKLFFTSMRRNPNPAQLKLTLKKLVS